MKKIITILIVVCLGASVLLNGCATAKKPQVNEKNPPDAQMGVPQQTDDAEKRVMATRLSNLAMGVNGVQKATVVVSETSNDSAGKTTPIPTDGKMTVPGVVRDKLVAMVGLQLDPKAAQDKNREMAIMNEVEAKIRADSPKVSEVLLTTSPDMIKKLQDVAAGVIQGKPVQSYAQDIDELNKNIRGQ